MSGERKKRKKPSNVRRGRSARRKGKDGELEAAKALGDMLGIKMRRGQQFSGKGPNSDTDIVGWVGVHVEVKRVEALSLYPSMEQAINDSVEGEVPIVMHRRNGKPWVVCCYLDDLEELSQAVTSELNYGLYINHPTADAGGAS